MKLPKLPLLISLLLWVAIFDGCQKWEIYKLKAELKTCIPSPIEIQERLQAEGVYHGELDGRIGPITMKAWNSYVRDRWANQFMTKTGAKK